MCDGKGKQTSAGKMNDSTKKKVKTIYVCLWVWEKAKWHITCTSNLNPFFLMDAICLILFRSSTSSVCLCVCVSLALSFRFACHSIAVITTASPRQTRKFEIVAKAFFSENNYIKQHERKIKLQCGLHVILLSFQRFNSATWKWGIQWFMCMCFCLCLCAHKKKVALVVALKLIIRNVWVLLFLCEWVYFCMNEFMLGIDKMLEHAIRTGKKPILGGNISQCLVVFSLFVVFSFSCHHVSSLCDEKLFENWEWNRRKTSCKREKIKIWNYIMRRGKKKLCKCYVKYVKKKEKLNGKIFQFLGCQ